MIEIRDIIASYVSVDGLSLICIINTGHIFDMTHIIDMNLVNIKTYWMKITNHNLHLSKLNPSMAITFTQLRAEYISLDKIKPIDIALEYFNNKHPLFNNLKSEVLINLTLQLELSSIKQKTNLIFINYTSQLMLDTNGILIYDIKFDDNEEDKIIKIAIGKIFLCPVMKFNNSGLNNKPKEIIMINNLFLDLGRYDPDVTAIISTAFVNHLNYISQFFSDPIFVDY